MKNFVALVLLVFTCQIAIAQIFESTEQYDYDIINVILDDVKITDRKHNAIKITIKKDLITIEDNNSFIQQKVEYDYGYDLLDQKGIGIGTVHYYKQSDGQKTIKLYEYDNGKYLIEVDDNKEYRRTSYYQITKVK